MKKEQINIFIEALKEELSNNSVYIWGGSGERVRDLTVFDIYIMEDSRKNAGRVLRHIADSISIGKDLDKARAFDCSGLVLEGLKKAGVVSHDYDCTADQLYKQCRELKGTGQAKKGDLVFVLDDKGKAVHVGAVTTKGYVIEARGRDYGVTASKLKEGERWSICGTL